VTQGKARLLSILGVATLAFVVSGCGESESAVATVSGTKITHEDVESLVELYKRRPEAREGETKDSGKDQVSHAQEVGTLQVLVQRQMLALEARQLGVAVEDDAVDQLAERLEGRGSENRRESETDGEALSDQIRETARAQLLYQALHARITRAIRVPEREVISYYRSHRSSYPTPRPRRGNLPPAGVEEAIRRGLTATARDQAMAEFVARVRQEYAPKVKYSEGWSPHDANR